MAWTGISPQSAEPWVTLADGRDLAAWGRQEAIAYNQMNRQTQKLAFFSNAFDCLDGNEVRGDYFEFGCHRGRTFRMALTEARRHRFDQMRFVAFDSFEGLPEPLGQPDVRTYYVGALRTSEEAFRRLIRAHGVYVDRCELVKGLFQDSLTLALQRRLLAAGRKLALACIDCDLYESAVPVFRFIEPFLQEGSLLYIDDWFAGYKGSPLKTIAKAFHEFEQVSRFRFVPHMQIGWWGRSFLAYSGRPRRSR